MTRVSINGTATEIADNTTLDEVLRRYGIAPDTSGVAVALNEAVVPRDQWPTTAPKTGDRVEIIHAVQGG